MNPIVFLDIDGVLNNQKSLSEALMGNHPAGNKPFYTMDPDCVDILWGLVTLFDARIVITSTWRGKNLDDCQHIWRAFEWCGWEDQSFFIGVTRWLTTRGEEIEEFITANSLKDTPFIIIDDDAFDIHQKGNLIKTDSRLGFTEKDFTKAVSLFNSLIHPKIESIG